MRITLTFFLGNVGAMGPVGAAGSSVNSEIDVYFRNNKSFLGASWATRGERERGCSWSSRLKRC